MKTSVPCTNDLLCVSLQSCYEELEATLKEFVDNYKFIAIGIAIAICVIEVKCIDLQASPAVHCTVLYTIL